MGPTNTRVRRRTSTILNILEGEKLDFLIEISNDNFFDNKKKSVEWLVNKLSQEKCQTTVIYRTLHRSSGEFFVYLIRGHNRKVIFSSCDYHVDSVKGDFISRKNYLMILDCIVQFLEVKLDNMQ